MRSGVNDPFGSQFIGKIGIFRRVSGKSKLQDAHPREAKLLAKRGHFRNDDPQVFRDEGRLRQGLQDGLEKILARPRAIAPVQGGRFFGGDFPIAMKADEVVQADHVKELEETFKAPDPPGVPFLPVRVPVVNRVSPALAGF